jgi:hypothetical protein
LTQATAAQMSPVMISPAASLLESEAVATALRPTASGWQPQQATKQTGERNPQVQQPVPPGGATVLRAPGATAPIQIAPLAGRL